MRDLKTPWLIHAKGWLFLAIGVLSAALLLEQSRSVRTVLLLCFTVWGFCRFYYYLFYVLERYLGRAQRFSGIVDALRYLASRKKRDPEASPNFRNREEDRPR